MMIRLYGQDGNDILKGGTGQDFLVGGEGRDHIEGGSGSDTYIWNYGDGNDTIVETSDTQDDEFNH